MIRALLRVCGATPMNQCMHTVRTVGVVFACAAQHVCMHSRLCLQHCTCVCLSGCEINWPQ